MSQPNATTNMMEHNVQPSTFNVQHSQARIGPLNQEIKEITALYNVAVAVGSNLNLKEVIQTLYKETGRLIDTTNFALVLYDKSTDMLDFNLVFDQGRQLKPYSVNYANNQGMVARVLANEAPLLIHDLLETDHIFAPNQPTNQPTNQQTNKPARSWLGVPILNPVLSHEGAQGVIATWSYKPDSFSERELWLLSAIATQAAIAIRNAHLYEASQRRTAEMTSLKDVAQQWAIEMAVLNDFIRTLSVTLQFDEVLARFLERVESIVKVEAGWLLLTDPAKGDLVFQIALGDKAPMIKPFRLPRGQGLAGQVALTGKPLLVKQPRSRGIPMPGEVDLSELEQKVDLDIHNLLCVPLILRDQVIGVLQLINKAEGDFNQRDIELLSSIAPYAAIAIENARLHENVLAERDRVIEAEEQARKALARDLHDGPTQMVSAMLMRLDFCKLLLEKEPEKLAKEIDVTQELARRTIHQIRTLLFELRPLTLEMQGLVPALLVFMERRQADVSEETTRLNLEIKTINPNGEMSRYDDKVEGTIFSIVQETVNNALKHAQAANIVVKIEETFTAIYITVTDDGVGFEVDKVMSNYEQRESLGLLNIRERVELIGGELKLRSTLGQGTRLTVRIPKAKEERLRKRGTGPLSLPRNALPEA